MVAENAVGQLRKDIYSKMKKKDGFGVPVMRFYLLFLYAPTRKPVRLLLQVKNQGK